MEDIKTIACPNCGASIDVNKVMFQHLQEEMQSEFLERMVQVKKQYQAKHDELNAMRESLDKSKASMKEIIDKSVQEKILREKTKLEKTLRAQIDEEKSLELDSYKEQLEQKVQEAKGLNKLKAEYERLQREKNELKEKIEAEIETKFNKQLEDERKRIGKEVSAKSDMKVLEKEMIIDQLKEQLKIAQRKAEQGSMQLQGEVQELAIEDFLKENFRDDTIKEIRKGARGADCLHIINHGAQVCGSIYYESKRTKDFQKTWLDKFKKDLREVKAEFGVLVTDCYPKGIQRMTQINGIWVCSFEEFQGLSFVLRESVLLLHSITASEENRTSKMEMLYAFLTGSQFRAHVEAIVEGFSQMQDDVIKERRAMEGLWKQREKQIQMVLVNTTQMYGSIQGIAGKAVGTIKALQLPGA